jgi:hypothetical protein
MLGNEVGLPQAGGARQIGRLPLGWVIQDGEDKRRGTTEL